MSNPVEARTDLLAGQSPAKVTPLAMQLSTQSPEQLLADARNVLGVVSFGSDHSVLDDPRHIRVPLPTLGGTGHCEVWSSQLPVEHGRTGDIAHARNGEVIFAQLAIGEGSSPDFEAISFDAYRRIRNFLESEGYPYPTRIWNYFPNINQGADDTERYKQFCLGRARAIQDSPDYEQRLPAASAIGSAEPGLMIYLIAARKTGVQVENPRQVSAFHYPRQYGPKSPSFSRARLMRWASEYHLYLSGTSSVVGHETLHENDCRAQLAETLHNIDILLEQVSEADASARLGWEQLQALRVYLRRPQDLEIARQGIAARLGPDAPVVYLRGDICRQDLLLEIEGVYTAPVAD